MASVVVSGGFDDLRSGHVRFLHEASKRGPVRVLLRSDEALERESGRPPCFSFAERRYFLEAVRFVHEVVAAPAGLDPDTLPSTLAVRGSIWAVTRAVGPASEHPTPAKRDWCEAQDIGLIELRPEDLSGFPADPVPAPADPHGTPPRAVATGSFDWLHTGHVRFFEEASAYGELTVVVGHDANIRLLKGGEHPRFPQEERRYMVGAMRSVARALISTGSGWLDAEPELRMLAPRWYVVNEDGDKPEKQRFCEEHGIQYVVLKRVPREGLPRRASTDLRGF
jgi:cytidyltransferase-like protein